MKSVASGFSDDIDLAAAEFSILRVEVAGDNAELINRIQVGNHGRAGVDILFHVGAVHAEIVGELPLPIHREGARIERARRVENGGAYILYGSGGNRCLRSNSGLQREQVSVGAAVEWNRGHLPSGDHLAQLRA